VPIPITPTVSPGAGSVHDVARDDDELAVAAGACEPEQLGPVAEVGLAAAAAAAAVARNVPLADDAVAGGDFRDVLPHRGDDPTPLVAGDQRKDGEAGQLAGGELEIRSADAGSAASDKDVVGPVDRLRDLAKDHLVRSLDDDSPHRGLVYFDVCRPPYGSAAGAAHGPARSQARYLLQLLPASSDGPPICA
jgi:hypothetical protein